MPRFFFDYHVVPQQGDSALEPDEEGLVIADAESACTQAIVALTEIAQDLLPRLAHREIGIEIRDDDGLLVKTRIVFEIVKLR